MIINPFSFGNPIKEPSHFFNRNNEIRQIVNRLLSAAHESTSVIGERRIGKTSLLKHLSNPDVSASYGLPKEQFCPIYIDFQGLIDITPQRFWQRVFKYMDRNICDRTCIPQIQALSKQSSYDLFDLEDLFLLIRDCGINIILYMDEFESITQNPRFGPDFFGGLRSLAIHSNLSLVTATQHALVDLCHSEEVKSSPFFNIFATVALRPFSQQDSYDFIDGSLRRSDYFLTTEEKDCIISLGGGHPFFLQMAGFYMVDEKNQGYKSTILLDRVKSDFEQQAASHYQYLWENCTESEKIILLTIIAYGRQKTSRKTSNIENLGKVFSQAYLDVPNLVLRGLLHENEGIFFLFSDSLERWVIREVTALPGDEESTTNVQGWIKLNGLENLKGVASVLPKYKKQYWSLVSKLIGDFSINLLSAGVVEILLKRI